jgi:hypothetical protein
MKALVYILLALLMTACHSTKYVTVPEYHTDSVYVSQIKADTLLEHDSVFVLVKGDTVYKERVKTVYKAKVVHDSVFLEMVDSVSYPVEVYVEKKLTLWQSVKVKFGGYAMFFLAAIAAIAFFLWKKKKNANSMQKTQ